MQDPKPSLRYDEMNLKTVKITPITSAQQAKSPFLKTIKRQKAIDHDF